MSSAVFRSCAVGVASQRWCSSAQEQQGGLQGKEIGARVTFCVQAVLQSFIKDEEGHVVAACARRLAAWIHSGKAARVGGPYQASHDMERVGLLSLSAFHDLTNAFGSVKWEAMDRAAAALLGPNSLLGQQRYRLASTTVAGKDGDVTLKIGEGGLMGDPLMVALFWVAFLPSTIRRQQLAAEEGAESGQLLAWHPWSGARMDLSLSQCADDTTKQIVAELGEDVMALADLLARLRQMGSLRTEVKRSSSCTWLEQAPSKIVGERGVVRCRCQARL